MAVRVPGEGPIPCDLMFIGEFPGIEEAKRGRPFVGKSGGEFMRFLNGYELPVRAEVYLTNLSKTPAMKAKDFRFTEDDERDLWNEIIAVHPRTIVTLGHHSTRYFLGPDATLEAMHAIPHKMQTRMSGEWIDRVPYFGESVPMIFPCYNPAAALHAPSLQATFAQDMKYLSLFLKGKLQPAPVDERPGTYRLLDDSDQFYLGQSVIDVDTEGWASQPWGLSWSVKPYTGNVVRAGSLGLRRFIAQVQAYRPRLTLHNALHDLDVLRALGLDLDEDGIPFDDTMIMAYLLGLEPQGLKPLAYRHAGMVQDDYSDVVAEPNDRIALEWLIALYDRLPDTPEKLTKKAIKAGAVQRVLTEDEVPLAKAKKLIGAMIGKADAKRSLRARWADCRAREILTDDTYTLPPDAQDPPEATLDDVPLDRAVQYAGRDADCTHRIRPSLSSQIEAMGLTEVYAVDLGVVPMFNRMQNVGLKADLDHFRDLSLMLAIEQRMNLDALQDAAGRPINPNSGDQVAALLFDELKLHEQAPNLRLKRTASGTRFSTNDKTLEALEDIHPIVTLITEGREIGKIKGTFADPMPGMVKADGRLHPRYRITRTDTGRPSAADPNVLAFPKHSARGKLVRDGFIAEDGRELGEWDLDQIEMRVFAHDSEDESMIATFLAGVDMHRATAGLIFGKRPEDVTDEERFAAKAVNFGILMGITEFGLLGQFHKNGQLQWTLDDCVRLLAEWHIARPQGSSYIESKHAEARRYGFVRDMWGRIRWVEGVHSDDPYIRAEAERQAQATPTQSGAQGIMKRIMRAVWPAMKTLRREFWVEPLLQIHDALITEHDRRRRDEIDGVVMAAMHTTVELRVPVTAKAKYGQRWGDL